MANSSEQSEGRWAPWWIYVVLIIGLNVVKQQLMDGAPALLNIAVTVLLVGALLVGITAVYRKIHTARR